VPDAELTQKLACLESRRDTLQEHIAQLALALLQERERSVEHRISTLESLLHQFLERQMPHPPVAEVRKEFACSVPPPRPLHPADHLARSRRPALIEYSAPGIYVIIVKEGEGPLEPDSRAWFDWLATLSSFRFVGAARAQDALIAATNRASRHTFGRLRAVCVVIPTNTLLA
jgi:hypothetical protein